MKPRPLPEPLTEEDRAAWFDWQVNRGRDLRLWGALERSFESDRRDADLMLWAQVQRLGGDVRHLDVVNVGGKWCGSMWWYADLVRVGGNLT